MIKKSLIILFLLINITSLIYANTNPINEQKSTEFFDITDTTFNYINIFLGVFMFGILLWTGTKFLFASSLEKRQEAKRALLMSIIGFFLFIILPIFLDVPFAINNAISLELFN